MMRIAITGGTGFLGQEVARHCLAAGYEVISLSRGHISAQGLPRVITTETCDIHDTARLSQLLRGCDAVVHCAAKSSPWGRRQDFFHHNAAGTAQVVRAAENAGVRRLIHISSSSVYFDFKDQLQIAENAPWPRPANAYAASKQQAERAAHDFGGEVFILRPRGLFGAGDTHLLPRLLRVMRRGTLPLLRSGAALTDLTHVSVAADAVLAALAAPASTCGAYNVSQGQPLSIRRLAEVISQELHLPFRWRRLPVAPILGAARLLEGLARLDPWGREPVVTAYGLGLFAFSQTLDLSAARAQLGWQPRAKLQDSLIQTLASFRHSDEI